MRAFALASLLVFWAGCSCTSNLGSNDAGADGRSLGVRLDECGNGLDDDGNGAIDDGCPCAPGEMQRCFSGALSSNEVGACASGTQICDVVSGSEWGDWGLSDCVGEVVAATETCDGSDADCDGAVDEGCPCMAGMERSCGDEFVSAPCRAGTQSCRSGTWSSCEGAIGPSSDVCEDAIDNDCDGMVNEGCDCAYPPTPERCRDGVDNDCDGVTDEPECTPDWSPDAGVPSDAGMCDPSLSAPRLIAPLSTSRVTSHRPTVRWVLPVDRPSARLELCADPACATVLEVMEGVESARPTRPLPIGPVFFRVRTIDGSRVGCDTSHVWEMFVTAQDAPVDTTQGFVLDVDRDGLPDLLAGGRTGAFSASSPTYLWLGRDASPTELVPAAGAYWSFQMLGDVDGDGFGDIAVEQVASGGVLLGVHLLRGSASGVLLTPAWTFPETLIDIGSGVGDMDGDGYGDLTWVESIPGPTGNIGLRMQIRYGAASPAGAVVTTPATGEVLFASGRTVDLFRHNAFPHRAGDVDGDGLADLVLATLEGFPDPTSYVAVLVRGRADRTSAAVPLAARTEVPRLGTPEVYVAGDLNGDGFGDLLFGYLAQNAVGTSTATVFYGSAAGPGALTTITHPVPVFTSGPRLGAPNPSATRLGDVNGDGIEDVELFGELRLGTTSGVGPAVAPLPNRCAFDFWAACHLTGLTDRDADGDDDVVGLSGFGGTLELREGEPSGLGAPTPLGPGMLVYGTGVLSGSGP